MSTNHRIILYIFETVIVIGTRHATTHDRSMPPPPIYYEKNVFFFIIIILLYYSRRRHGGEMLFYARWRVETSNERFFSRVREGRKWYYIRVHHTVFKILLNVSMIIIIKKLYDTLTAVTNNAAECLQFATQQTRDDCGKEIGRLLLLRATIFSRQLTPRNKRAATHTHNI